MLKNAVGIFDSGVGGLTVFHEIRRLLPHEDLVYLGDTARVPYGTKSPDTVRKYALEAANFLVRQQVKMVVVACNTASSFALSLLQEALPVSVVGVIVPGAQRAVGLTRSGRVGVIGTEGTVTSDAYPRALRALNPLVEVFSVACPLFVPLAEEGWAEHEVAHLAARDYLAPLLLAQVDTLVLGCTHYPLLKPTLKKVLPATIQMVDSAAETALTVQRLLARDGLLNNIGGSSRFFVTDVPDRFVRVGESFLGMCLDQVVRVRLPADGEAPCEK